MSARTRYAHLVGQNPHVLARGAAAEASDTGEVAVVGPEVVDELDSSRLVRSSALVGLGTLLSRLTGLVRVGALTYALGTAALADAYNLANTTPNIVYELLIGGVLSATLVPIFVERFAADDDDAVSAVFTVATVALLALTAIAVVAAPLLFAVYDDGTGEAGVPLLRLFLVQILFYGWTALGTAALNARRRFAVPAFAPVLNNVVVSIALVAFARRFGADPGLDAVTDDRAGLLLLGLGTTAGIVAMTVVLLPALRRAGVRLRWRLVPRHPAVRTVVRRSTWTLGYVAANQAGLVTMLAVAAHTRQGLPSAYTYAFIFFQLPHGLVAVSVMTTSTPGLAAAWGAGQVARFREGFDRALRLVWVGVVPATAAIVVAAHPLVGVLLERGAFDAEATSTTGDVLATMAIGLPGFSAYLYAQRGFYAQGDTRTPFFLNLGENALQVLLTVLLVPALDRPGLGLGLAYAVAYSVAAVAALVTLGRRVPGLTGAALAGATTRLAAAAVIGAGAAIGARAVVGPGSVVVEAALLVVVTGVVFVVAALAGGLTEVRSLLGAVTGRARSA